MAATKMSTMLLSIIVLSVLFSSSMTQAARQLGAANNFHADFVHEEVKSGGVNSDEIKSVQYQFGILRGKPPSGPSPIINTPPAANNFHADFVHEEVKSGGVNSDEIKSVQYQFGILRGKTPPSGPSPIINTPPAAHNFHADFVHEEVKSGGVNSDEIKSVQYQFGILGGKTPPSGPSPIINTPPAAFS